MANVSDTKIVSDYLYQATLTNNFTTKVHTLGILFEVGMTVKDHQLDGIDLQATLNGNLITVSDIKCLTEVKKVAAPTKEVATKTTVEKTDVVSGGVGMDKEVTAEAIDVLTQEEPMMEKEIVAEAVEVVEKPTPKKRSTKKAAVDESNEVVINI